MEAVLDSLPLLVFLYENKACKVSLVTVEN